MSVDQKHPYYDQFLPEWQLVRDSYRGESAIKARSEKYLPKPSGFKAMPDGGDAMYDAYKGRANFPEIFSTSVGAMIGIIHSIDTQVEMPEQMNFILQSADGNKCTLDEFHKVITKELLISGRYGLLAEAPQDGGNPYLAGFNTETIINWDKNFFVLDETTHVRNGFEWEEVEQYLVL
ncbi:unnamed protein product [Ectocarpus sp. 12 AP-2014]